MSEAGATKMVPAIRFDGFDGDWVENPMGDIGEFKNGMNFSKDAMGHGYPFVNLQDVFGTNTVRRSKLGLAVSTEKQRKDYSLFTGDVLFVRSSVKPEGVGEASIITECFDNTTYSGFIIRFRPTKKMAVSFNQFVYATKNVRAQILSSASSSANTNINQLALQNVRITTPKIEEQTKIGAYFQQLDALIAGHRGKRDKLLQLKKSLLEKMFPKQGQDKPEIRFAGFDGDWAEERLGEIAETFSGGTPSVGNSDYYGGKVPFIRSAEINSEATELFITDTGLNDSSARMIEPGTVLYALYGATSGEVGRAKIAGAINQAILAIYPYEGYSSEFLIQWLRRNKSSIIGVYLQGGQGNLSGAIVKNFEIKFPKPDEQTKIGQLFKHTDTLINQHQKQITKLEQVKAACLAKMFV